MVCRRFAVLMLAAATSLLAGAASGQNYPTKPVHILTDLAGTGNDWIARVVGQELTVPLGQQVIVENRNPLIAAGTVSRAGADGHLLLVAGESLWLAPLVRKDVSYDPVRDLAPVSLIARQVSLVAVHPSVQAKTVKELVTLAKAKPGALNYGFSVADANSRLSPELFKAMAGANIVPVGYKNLAQATSALMAGEVQLAIMESSVLTPNMAKGKLRALAIANGEPSALFSRLPTVAATGLPGYETMLGTGLWAPGKTPAPIVDRLNRELVKVLAKPGLRDRFSKVNASEVVANSPEQFATGIRNDMARWAKIIKEANIKVE